MRFTKLCLFLASMSALVISSDRGALATALNADPALAVSVTVANNCLITTVAVGFPDYDPIVTHTAGHPDHSTSGSVKITCNKGAGTSIFLGFGSHASPADQPRMANGSDFLEYKLYSDATWNTLWSGATRSISPAPSNAEQTFVVYGEIPGGQPAVSGTYNDSVVATLNF